MIPKCCPNKYLDLGRHQNCLTFYKHTSYDWKLSSPKSKRSCFLKDFNLGRQVLLMVYVPNQPEVCSVYKMDTHMHVSRPRSIKFHTQTHTTHTFCGCCEHESLVASYLSITGSQRKVTVGGAVGEAKTYGGSTIWLASMHGRPMDRGFNPLPSSNLPLSKVIDWWWIDTIRLVIIKYRQPNCTCRQHHLHISICSSSLSMSRNIVL